MRTILAVLALTAISLSAQHAGAGERTITLAVDNMSCPSCPYIVKHTLAAVPGVESVAVSYERKTAVVTFDDARTDPEALIDATGRMGYPSRPLAEGG